VSLGFELLVRRIVIELAFEFADAAVGVFGLPDSGLGLLPGNLVAAQQVIEQLPAFRRVIKEASRGAHNMNYTRSFML
jgi:hypothetical protein